MGSVIGVSSFGYSGTNGHAILASKPNQDMSTILTQPEVYYHHISVEWWDTNFVNHPPLLGVQITSKSVLEFIDSPDAVVWQRAWPVRTCGYMAQHTVGCTPTVPNTCFLYMAQNTLIVGQHFFVLGIQCYFSTVGQRKSGFRKR